jgi:FecR protein
VILLGLSPNTIAAIGTITEQVNMPPSIQRSAKTLEGQKGSAVEMQDAIRTARGKVGITFQDDTRVQVNENSRLVIDDFVYDPKRPAVGKLALNMAAGTVRYASGAIAKNDPNRVSLNTPSATIAVRGTDFSATVDELGGSIIILLPSCPAGYRDIQRDCKTGSIEVITDVGKVVLDQAFQATRVETRGIMPLKPVVLKIGEDAINNMLIVAPPKQLDRNNERTQIRAETKGALDVDFLKETGLVNAFDAQQKDLFQDTLSRNFLDQTFLANILDIINAQLAAQLDLLNNTKSGLLPDYTAVSGIVATVDDNTVTLSRDNGSDVMSVTMPKNQQTTIYMTQGPVEFRNRVNSGNNTTISLIQK